MPRQFCTIHGLNYSHATVACRQLNTLAVITSMAVRATLSNVEQTRVAPVQNVAKMIIEARRQKRREKKRKYRLRKAARKKHQEAPSGAEITESPQANDSLPNPLCSGLPDWNLLKVEDDNKSKI